MTGPGRQRQRGLAYLFVAPAAGLTVAFSLVPLGMLAYRSLFRGGVFATTLRFAGLGHALAVTAAYTAGFVLLTMAAGLGIALLLNTRTPGAGWFRAPFIIPLTLPAVATALIWQSMASPQFGLLSRGLRAAGLPQPDFLSSPRLALLTVLTFGAWQFFGQNVILYLAALKELPLDVMDAASVDGAGPWRRFRCVSWPLLRRNTLLISVVTTLTGLQAFTQIYVLTQGGPDSATQTALYFVYNEGFVQFDTGRADAMGVLLFGLSLLITMAQIGVLARGARGDR